MGIRHGRLALLATLLFGLSAVAHAAPKLRLSTAAIGPVTVVQGSNGTTQTVEVYNAGDGSLVLSVSSSASWLAASAGSPRACTTRAGSCIPLQLGLNTASLAGGSYTAVATVSDPDAIDAPQTVTVTVQVGSAFPNSVDLYVAPGAVREVSFTAGSAVKSTTATQGGGSWLSLVLESAGSFKFPYRVRIAPAAGVQSGQYGGTIAISGSTFAPDNKTVSVTMRVTTQPIGEPLPARLQLRLAQGAPKQVLAVTLRNLGQGSIAISGVTASGGAWLTASAASANVAVLTVDTEQLSPGSYTGGISIASNAANGDVSVPVELEVVAKSAPLVRYQGVVDNGTFGAGDPVSRGDVAVVLGEQLSFEALKIGSAPPLDTQVGGTRVLVNGQAAPMYYTSYGQVAFQMPMEAPLGSNVVQVEREGQPGNKVSVDVVETAPRLLRINIEDFGAITIQDKDISYLAMPSSYQIGVPVRPARIGETITIWAIGLGPTNPPVATGAAAPAAEPFARLAKTAVLNFGGGIAGIQATPSFAALAPGFAGLYQVNVVVPKGTPKGNITVTLSLPGASSNAVRMAVE